MPSNPPAFHRGSVRKWCNSDSCLVYESSACWVNPEPTHAPQKDPQKDAPDSSPPCPCWGRPGAPPLGSMNGTPPGPSYVVPESRCRAAGFAPRIREGLWDFGGEAQGGAMARCPGMWWLGALLRAGSMITVGWVTHLPRIFFRYRLLHLLF